MSTLELSSRERSALRANAHALRPVVLIGDKGLSDAVLKEIDRALTAHALIKVRAGGEERDVREEMLGTLCAVLSCAVVHHLGKTFILFRPHPDQVPPPALKDSHSSKRRTHEPYTPKKLAAEGKTISIKRRTLRPTVDADVQRIARVERNNTGKPARPSTRQTVTASHGIARRNGSALSLRAGARSGLRRTVRPRKK